MNEESSVDLARIGDTVRAFVETTSGSDRASVIVSAARLDSQLKEILSSLLVSVSPKRERLVRRGPLSSFAARIEICYRLSLIDAPIRDVLDGLRALRNEAAHFDGEFSLTEPTRLDRVRSLKDALAIPKSLEAVLGEQLTGSEEGLSELRQVLILVSGALESLRRDIAALAEPRALYLNELDLPKGVFRSPAL